MPKIVVSSVDINRPTSSNLIQPILGLCSEVNYTNNVFVKTEDDLFTKIGSQGLEKERLLLSQGYNLRIAPKWICEPHYKLIRILDNGSYCYPNIDSEVSTETRANYNFEELYTGDQTLSVRFPIVDFQDGDYILLNVGQFYALLYWGDTIEVSPLLAGVFHQVTSINDLKSFLELRCGFSVEDFGSYLLLSKSVPFGTSYFTNISDYDLTPDLNGISDIINKYVKTLIEIRTKNSRYQDDVHIRITKNLSGVHVISVIVYNKVLEQFTFDFTSSSVNLINEQSNIIQISLFDEGDINGEYVLKRDFKGTCHENKVTQEDFSGFPYITALITKDFATQENQGVTRLPFIFKDNVIAFDSNTKVNWQNGIAKHEGSCELNGIKLDSEIYFFLRLRQGSVLGESTEIDTVQDTTDDEFNGFSEEYSFELLRWIFRENGDLVSVIPTLTLKIIETAYRNNLQGVQSVTRSLINTIAKEYMSWLTSFKDIEVLSIERVDQTQIVNIQVTVDGFTGISKTVNLTISI